MKFPQFIPILQQIFIKTPIMKLLYIHGYNGSPNGNSYKLLQKHLPNNWEIIGMDYFQDDCTTALCQIKETIIKEKIDVVVGSSLGGYLALLITGVKRYIINPCYKPSIELPKLKSCNELPTPSKEMINSYAEYEHMISNIPPEDKKNIYGIFGDNDELLGDTYIECFMEDIGKSPIIIPSGHHLSDDIAKFVCYHITIRIEDLENAHKLSAENKEQIAKSSLCGCFSCCKIFTPDKIEDWIQEKNGKESAICPYCYSDTILGNASNYPVNENFLRAMNERWF